MNCDFSTSLTCPACGYRAKHAKTFRRCRPPADPKPVMVGDLVAAGLERIGVTKELASKVVGGDCGCERRQSWMNQAGIKAQEYARKAIRQAGKFYGLE
jgi:hypothetical protein